MLPVAVCTAAAHLASVFALSAGAVSFGQIVKASEPAFAAVIGTVFYGQSISVGKWLMLIPIIWGVVLASVKELDFAWSALIAASLANIFASFKGAENAKCMSAPGLKDDLGSVGNQFAVTLILAFFICVVVALITEGDKLVKFVALCQTSPVVFNNLILSGLTFYAYNEVATMTIQKTGAVASSVANTAKRAIVIIGVAMVMGVSLEPMKLLGCVIGIGGVMMYALVDVIFPPAKKTH